MFIEPDDQDAIDDLSAEEWLFMLRHTYVWDGMDKDFLATLADPVVVDGIYVRLSSEEDLMLFLLKTSGLFRHGYTNFYRCRFVGREHWPFLMSEYPDIFERMVSNRLSLPLEGYDWKQVIDQLDDEVYIDIDGNELEQPEIELTDDVIDTSGREIAANILDVECEEAFDGLWTYHEDTRSFLFECHDDIERARRHIIETFGLDEMTPTRA